MFTTKAKNSISKKNKVVTFVSGVCAIVFVLLAFANIVGRAAGNYQTADAMGAKKLEHYNAILYGDWFAKQADIEGAIAVQGNVTLATTGPFSIAANGEKKVVGPYDPSAHGFPVAVFGLKPPGQAITRLNNVTTHGDVVFRDSASSQYPPATLQERLNVSNSALNYAPDEEVDKFFATARTFTNTVLNYFNNTETTDPAKKYPLGTHGAFSAHSNGLFGWRKYLLSKNINDFVVDMPGSSTDKIIVINCNDETITISELWLKAAYENYSLIVLNFPNAINVSFESAANIYVEGETTGVYQNATSGAKHQRQAEWANRMVWLFPKAGNITIKQASVVGSVIAPNAQVSGSGGNLNGMLIAKDLEQQGGFELHAFTLSPRVPEIVDKVDPPPEPDKLVNVRIAKRDPQVPDDRNYYLGLEGAVLRLQSREKDTDPWEDYYSTDVVTGEGGVAILEDLICGRYYRLVEIASPPGYLLPAAPNNETYFELDEDGVIKGTGTYTLPDGSTVDIAGNGGVRVFNIADTVALNFQKVWSDTSLPVVTGDGAVFGLRRVWWDENNVERDEIINAQLVPDAGGFIQLPPLGVGTYRLFEHTPPAGAVRPDEEQFYTITITDARGSGDSGPNLVWSVTDWNGDPVGADSPNTDYVIKNDPLDPGDDEDIEVDFIKVSVENGVRTPLPGAVFNVYLEVFDPPSGSPISPGLFPGLVLPEDEEQNSPSEDDAGEDETTEGDDDTADTPQDEEPGQDNAGETGEEDNDLPVDGISEPLRAGIALYSEPVTNDPPEPEEPDETPDEINTEDQEDTDEEDTSLPQELEGDSVRRPSAMPPSSPADMVEGEVYEDLFGAGRYWQLVAKGVESSNLSGDRGYIYSTQAEKDQVYLLQEVETPAGYIRTEEFWEFKIGDDSRSYRFFIENTPEIPDGSFTFKKVDEDGAPVLGAVFELYKKDANGSWRIINDEIDITDASGIQTLSSLALGDYWLHEVAAPKGYLLANPNTYFRITKDSASPQGDGTAGNPYIGRDIGVSAPVEVVNENFTTKFTLLKVNRADETIVLPGVRFLVQYRARFGDEWTPYTDGPSHEGNGWYITDSNGEVTAPLREGNYRITEIQTLEGYKITSAMYDFTVDSSHSPSEIKLRVFNEPTVVGSVDVRKVDYDETTRGLQGTTFTLYALPDAEYRYVLKDLQDGNSTLQEVIGHTSWAEYAPARPIPLKTDANGELTISNLESGFYKLVETTPPSGYTLWGNDRDVILFEMRFSDSSNTSVVLGDVFGSFTARDATVLEFQNESDGLLYGEAVFYKEGANGEGPLADAEFRLDMLAGGIWVEQGRYTSSTGTFTITNLRPGKYRVVETQAPSGYALVDIPYEFDMEEDATGTVVEMKPGPFTVENDLLNSNIAITVKKVDHDANSVALPGTTFRLTRYTGADSDEVLQSVFSTPDHDALLDMMSSLPEAWNPYHDRQSNLYVTSGAAGEAVIDNLVTGLYRIEEINPPPGYALWGDERDVIYAAILDKGRGSPYADNGAGNVGVLIVGNHVDGLGQVVFADKANLVDPDNPNPTPSKPGTAGTQAAPATWDNNAKKLILYEALAILSIITNMLLLVARLSLRKNARGKKRRL